MQPSAAPTRTTSSSRRPTHRKRFSTTRLSTETAGTLPEYNSPPPEYSGVNSSSTAVSSASESVDDCDADTEDDYYSAQTLRITHSQPQTAPSSFALASPPKRKRPIYKQKSASTSRLDSALDSLLERSVHALEMSNALLQQQQSSTTPSFMIDSPREEETFSTSHLRHPNYHHHTVPSKSINIRSAPALRQRYDDLPADEFDEVTRKVDDLQLLQPSPMSSDSLSQSLPTKTPSMPMPHKPPSRKTSLDSERRKDGAVLRLAALDRRHLVSQAPRPITQYIESTDDLNAIVLPSTLGLRAPASTHHAAECQPPSSMVIVNKEALDAASTSTSTPAFALLSSLVSASNSSSPSSSYIPKSTTFLSRRGSSSDRSSTIRASRTPSSQHSSSDRSRSTTPKPLVGSSSTSSPVRPMTPPIEGDSPSSTSDSDQSLHPKARLTVQSLHAILDAHPPPTPPSKPRKQFMPRTPSAQATAIESTTTASVSRLFTKGVHSSSTRPPSPPRRSVLKRRPGDANSDPSPSSSTPNSAGPSTPAPTAASSVPSSRSSTPTFYGGGSQKSKKRISFAALPEPHVSSTRESTAAKRKRKSGNKKNDKGKSGGKSGNEEEDEDDHGGWVTWLFGAAAAAGVGPGSGIGGGPSAGAGSGNGRTEERMEERIARGWGGVGRGGAFDEWGV
jgi:hypothetical protein